MTVAFSCRFRFYFTRAMPTPEERFRLLVQAGASYVVCAYICVCDSWCAVHFQTTPTSR